MLEHEVIIVIDTAAFQRRSLRYLIYYDHLFYIAFSIGCGGGKEECKSETIFFLIQNCLFKEFKFEN